MLAPLQLPSLRPGSAASPADPGTAAGFGHSPAAAAPLSAAAVYMPDWVPEDKRQQVVEALAAFYSHDGAPQEFDPVADMQRAISYFAPASARAQAELDGKRRQAASSGRTQQPAGAKAP